MMEEKGTMDLAGPAPPRSVLLVDDDVDELWYLVRSLRRRLEGVEVCMARSGRDALSVLTVRPVDVIVSDYHMPGMDGIEFLASARQIRPGSIRYLMSGNPDPDLPSRAVTLGAAHGFVEKVADSARLVALVTNALE